MKKLDYDYVLKSFQEHGCKLLENDYKNARTPLKYLCECGQTSSIRFGDFKKGNRCKSCGKNKLKIVHANSSVDIESCFENAGYKLLEHYVDTNTPILCECPSGHKNKISHHNFKAGKRCRQCFYLRRSGAGNNFWQPDRKALALRTIVRKKCYSALDETHKAIGKKKNAKSSQLLGYTCSDLKNHIENHANWNFVCKGKWHLDHIFPIRAFVDFGICDVKLINSLDNLQPLSEKDNLSKSDNYDGVHFRQWLQAHGVQV